MQWKKGSSEITLSHIPWDWHWSWIWLNTERHLLTALLHISWVMKHSGINFIVEYLLYSWFYHTIFESYTFEIKF